MKECRIELEGDTEDGNDDVRKGQVCNVEVGDGVHGAGAGDHEYDQDVAENGQETDTTVAKGEDQNDA